MDFELGQIIKMKKAHPCGENRWEILRVGMDFRRQFEPCFRLTPPGKFTSLFPCISNLSML